MLRFPLAKTRPRNMGDFGAICDEHGGYVQWREDGDLLECVKGREEYDAETEVLFTQYDARENAKLVADIARNPRDEKLRLVRYMYNVYPSAPVRYWASMPERWLSHVYRNVLEVYYELPGGYMPLTPQATRRSRESAFYRTGDEVNLQQKENPTAAPSDYWLEVYHLGDMNTDFTLPDPSYFTGTYYYPVVGSGAWLNVGDTIVAQNKVDALRQLGVPGEEVYKVAGPHFKAVVSQLQERGNLSREKAIEQTIKRISEGQNTYTTRGGAVKYLGLGGSQTGGDAFLANHAVHAGYDTVQLLQEPQLGYIGDKINVGFELIDLRKPDASSDGLYAGLIPPGPYLTQLYV